MKILLISDSQSIHTRRWVEALEAEGWEVHLVSFRPLSTPGHHFHLLRNFGLGKLGYFFAIPQLKRLATRIRPDIVHAHHLTSYGFLAALAGLSPLVVTAWGSDVLLSPKDSWVLRQFVRYALRRADQVTVVAKHMKIVAENLGATESKILVIPFGVDLGKFPWRTPEQLPSEPIRVICTRGFSPVYDIPTFIRGLAILHHAEVDFRVDLVGGGPLKEEIMKLVRELGLTDRVLFRGRLEPAEMAAALAAADLFVSPSLSDGNNISLNEAMACGTIPIVSRIPANEAWVTEGDSGFFFSPGSASELADAIRRALLARPHWAAIAKRNREVAEAQADWKKCVQTTIKLYQSTLKGIPL